MLGFVDSSKLAHACMYTCAATHSKWRNVSHQNEMPFFARRDWGILFSFASTSKTSNWRWWLHVSTSLRANAAGLWWTKAGETFDRHGLRHSRIMCLCNLGIYRKTIRNWYSECDHFLVVGIIFPHAETTPLHAASKFQSICSADTAPCNTSRHDCSKRNLSHRKKPYKSLVSTPYS